MISFDDRHGPADAAPAEAYPDLTVPAWYRDAKLGLFVHWGLYSVPAWADVLDRSDVTSETAYARHQYAEWYANTVRIAGSPTRQRHERLYGVGHSYEDFADDWHPSADAVPGIVELAGRAGARYVVPTTKHHDGFCLWDSATTPFTTARRGPGRDLIAEFAAAVRAKGLRLGLYYSGAHDWHASEFPPLTSHHELFALRRNDQEFAAFAAAQLRELIDRFAPDLLWNDIDWPDAGKADGPDALQELFREHLAAVPDGLVNDRWGVPVRGVLTREYQEITEVQEEVFESTRGLGLSFGYNADESAEHALDGTALIRLLADVVSKNGNLLINVGPRADGSIPELQRRALEELGQWLGLHGAAIYGTRPWFHEAVRVPPEGVRFTLGPGAHRADGPHGPDGADGADAARGGGGVGGAVRTDEPETLHVLLLDPAVGSVTLDEEVSAAIREVAQVPGAGDGAGPSGTTGAEDAVPPGALDAGGRITLTPEPGERAVSVVSLCLR